MNFYKIVLLIVLLNLVALDSYAFEPVGSKHILPFQIMVGGTYSKHEAYDLGQPNTFYRELDSVNWDTSNIGLDLGLSYQLLFNLDLRAMKSFHTLIFMADNNGNCSSGNYFSCPILEPKWPTSGLKLSGVYYLPSNGFGLEVGTRLIKDQKMLNQSEVTDLNISGQSIFIGSEYNPGRFSKDKLTMITSIGYEHFLMDIHGRLRANENYHENLAYGSFFVSFIFAGNI